MRGSPRTFRVRLFLAACIMHAPHPCTPRHSLLHLLLLPPASSQEEACDTLFAVCWPSYVVLFPRLAGRACLTRPCPPTVHEVNRPRDIAPPFLHLSGLITIVPSRVLGKSGAWRKISEAHGPRFLTSSSGVLILVYGVSFGE